SRLRTYRVRLAAAAPARIRLGRRSRVPDADLVVDRFHRHRRSPQRRVAILILDDIDPCQYSARSEALDRPRRPPPPGRRRPDPSRDPPPARGRRRGLRPRLHRPPRSRPATGQPPSQGSPRIGLGPERAAGLVHLLLPAARGARPLQPARPRARARGRPSPAPGTYRSATL